MEITVLKLKQSELDMLKKCVSKWNNKLMWVLETTEYIREPAIINELRSLVGDELIEQGLENDNPTPYGLQLETLIDKLGRIFLP